MAERSLTFFPLELLLIKNRYALPDVAFCGLSLDLKIPDIIPIKITPRFAAKFEHNNRADFSTLTLI